MIAQTEAQIFALRQRLSKVEEVFVQPHQQRNAFKDRRGRQVRTFGSGEQPQGTGVLPFVISQRRRRKLLSRDTGEDPRELQQDDSEVY